MDKINRHYGEMNSRVAINSVILNETNRVFKLYFPPSLRQKFLKDVKKIIPLETTKRYLEELLYD